MGCAEKIGRGALRLSDTIQFPWAKIIAIITLLILLVPSVLPAGENKTLVADFNSDGIKDTLKTRYDGGSGFSFTVVTLTDGRTKETFKYEACQGFGNFFQITPIDDKLLRKENEGFKKVIEKTIFGNYKYNDPDTSLEWLLDAYANNMQTKHDELFSQIILFTPRWIRGEMNIPESYCTVLPAERLSGIHRMLNEKSAAFNRNHNQGWLCYGAHNHGKPVLAARDDKHNVYRTAHAVILQSKGQYCWVFINDEDLMNGPQKLRWESIAKVAIVGDLVFIQHRNGRNTAEDHLFVVDYNKGIVGRFKQNVFRPEKGGENVFSTNREFFIIQSGKDVIKVSLAKIRQTLERQLSGTNTTHVTDHTRPVNKKQ